jgi:hypothetical protein
MLSRISVIVSSSPWTRTRNSYTYLNTLGSKRDDITHLAYKRFARTITGRPKVNRAWLVAFVATSALILHSPAVLCSAPWITSRVNWVAYSALGVLGVYFCLRLYWRLISLLLE